MLYCFFYIFVILAYLPGLIIIAKMKKIILNYPLLVFGFLGMFVFNAVGSILVLLKPKLYAGIVFFSFEYILMLITQAIIFYFMSVCYIHYKKNQKNKIIKLKLADKMITPIIIILIVVILISYFQNTNTFVIYYLLLGNLNQSNALDYRNDLLYSLPNFSLYRFGFINLPSILSTHVLLLSLAQNKFYLRNIFLILLCFVPPILLGTKSGILNVALVMVIGYMLYVLHNQKTGIITILTSKKIVFFMVSAFIPTIIFYIIYAKGQISADKMIYSIVYRITGVYSEAMAAVVPMVGDSGYLHGLTLPTIRGLLKHEQINLGQIVHQYVANAPGNASVPALGEGYVNFGWIGFISFALITFGSIILMQEICSRLKLGLFSYSLIAWLSYLSMMTATMSVFNTMISLTYTVFLIAMIALWHTLKIFKFYLKLLS